MKHVIYVALPLVLLAAAIGAQTAKVIPLTPTDSAQRALLQARLDAAQKAVADFDAAARLRYAAVLEGDPDASYSGPTESILTINSTGVIAYGCGITLSTDPAEEQKYEVCQKRLYAETAKNPPPKRRMWRKGWEYGVVYSDDWKYLVPAERVATPYSSGGTGCWVTSPVGVSY